FEWVLTPQGHVRRPPPGRAQIDTAGVRALLEVQYPVLDLAPIVGHGLQAEALVRVAHSALVACQIRVQRDDRRRRRPAFERAGHDEVDEPATCLCRKVVECGHGLDRRERVVPVACRRVVVERYGIDRMRVDVGTRHGSYDSYSKCALTILGDTG